MCMGNSHCGCTIQQEQLEARVVSTLLRLTADLIDPPRLPQPTATNKNKVDVRDISELDIYTVGTRVFDLLSGK